MKRNYLILVIILLSSVSFCFSQIKIDIKTDFNSKTKEMQAVKAGIIQMCQKVNWIKIGEIGEKYSFWIQNLEIKPNPENIQESIIKFNLELHTPAMFSKGKTLLTSNVSYTVNINEPLPFNDPPNLERTLKSLDSKMNLSGTSWFVLVAGTGGMAYLTKTITEIGGMLQKDFTPAEKTMGIWAGYYSLDVLYKMLKQQGEFN